MTRIWRGAVLAGVGLLVLWLERRRRARPYVERFERHTARNVAVAGLAAATVRLVETPIVFPAARWVTRRGWGVTAWLGGPRWLRTVVALLLLDYTLYVWHVLLHRVDALWRFHLVHHVDLDLDATTGLRFHAGELTLSVPWRVAQIAAIGVTPGTLVAWQTLTLASVLFHHSNGALPVALESRLSRVLVTPRMHAIHHSIDPSETNSNFSSGLALWDQLHRTLIPLSAAGAVTIGVAGYRDPREVGLGRILRLPFRVDLKPAKEAVERLDAELRASMPK
jgi:sterol desaturase/sphingolipid hydroxylase (fatty acid hydroxylase superfamily)